MNVQDLANQLARALNKSPEYQRMEKARKSVEANSTAKNMLKDFRNRQMELQKAQAAGRNNPTQLKQLEDMYKVMLGNAVLREYLEAELAFTRIMMSVQKTLAQAVGVDMNF